MPKTWFEFQWDILKAGFIWMPAPPIVESARSSQERQWYLVEQPPAATHAGLWQITPAGPAHRPCFGPSLIPNRLVNPFCSSLTVTAG